MKRIRGAGIVWLILFLLPVCGFSQSPAPSTERPSPSTLGNLRVSLLEGDIQIKTVDLGDWGPASINIPLKDEDELWVPEAGRLEIQILPATFVRLDQLSSLSVVRVSRGAEQVYLAQGRAYVNFNPGRGGMVQFDTPNSSIQVFERAVIKVDVTEQGDTDVSVLDGSVYVESNSGKTTVEGGHVLSLKGETDAEMAPLEPGDDWENWNVERDKRVFVKRESGRYLPNELRGYASDFDNNGKWVYVKEYGQVWTPTVVVSSEWAPYRVGRWTWIGGDYVWVSYEPWGWAPYHYGRWAFAAAIGWYWVPPPIGGVYWGPGFVGWVHTPTYVAWVPLAPREIYYGYGYFGPHSVNLYQTNINSIRVTNVYVNVRVRNSFTVINNNTFIHGHGWGGRLPDSPLRYMDTNFRGNPFLENRIHPGRPLIKAERSTMISINREISINRQPPPRVREMNVMRLRETRSIVRDRNVSAFSHGGTARPLDVRTREGIAARKPVEPRRVVGPGGELRTGGPGGPRGPKEKIDRGPVPKEKVDRGPVPREKIDRGPVPREKIDRGPGGPGEKVNHAPVPREKIDRGPAGPAGPGHRPGPMEKPQ